MTDHTSSETHSIEAVGPMLHLAAIGSVRSTRLGPAWAAVCGLVASGAFAFDGLNVLLAALVFIVADWAWPAMWVTGVRTDWAAPLSRWSEVDAPPYVIRLPYLRPGSPADRLLAWGARLGAWRHSVFAPMAEANLASLLAALTVGLALSAAIGWRALSLTLAAMALTGIGTLRAARTGLDSDTLRAMLYGTLPWWLGHAAFAPLTIESAAFGVIFGFAYRALIQSVEGPVSSAALIGPQVAGALALLAGSQPVAAHLLMLTVVAQAAVRAVLSAHAFVRGAQMWLMTAMLVCAVVVA